ncbi:MAG: hypothetical protein AMS16_05860 [Planctomycetes bacterium DG_58]|nr:MAG: hypothetical protein AMS16_05860 [Planctomycetes bacterium DG_58]
MAEGLVEFVQPSDGNGIILWQEQTPPERTDQSMDQRNIRFAEQVIPSGLEENSKGRRPPLSLTEEAELVNRAKTDPAAFEELYETNYSVILNYLYRRTLSTAVAEELTSNTFFKALRGLRGFRSRPNVPFRSWLYRIASNEAKMHWRSRKRHPAPLELTDDDCLRVSFAWAGRADPERTREKLQQYAQLHRAMLRLKERYQVVLNLRYFEGLKHEQVAEILGRKVGTVKSLTHRALKELAAILHEMDATL